MYVNSIKQKHISIQEYTFICNWQEKKMIFDFFFFFFTISCMMLVINCEGMTSSPHWNEHLWIRTSQELFSENMGNFKNSFIKIERTWRRTQIGDMGDSVILAISEQENAIQKLSHIHSWNDFNEKDLNCVYVDI